MNRSEEFKKILGRELDEAELEKVSGGAGVILRIRVSYTCPMCGSTHSFILETEDCLRYAISDWNVCGRTQNIQYSSGTDKPLLVRATDGKPYYLGRDSFTTALA